MKRIDKIIAWSLGIFALLTIGLHIATKKGYMLCMGPIILEEESIKYIQKK